MTRDEVVKLALERLLSLFERKDEPPALEPPEEVPAPKPKFVAGSQEWFRNLSAPKTAGGVSQNSIARDIRSRDRRAGRTCRSSAGMGFGGTIEALKKAHSLPSALPRSRQFDNAAMTSAT